MPSETRWQQAQAYERAWWHAAAKRISAGRGKNLDGNYRFKAAQMERRLEGLLSEEQKLRARVLEVGCGPIGNVSAIKWGERYAIDPLDDFYASQEVFAKFRDPAVRYSTAQGEKLAFPDKHFHLVVLENVLDHVQAAEVMLQEIRRVLADDGFLYFTVNVRRPFGTAFHKVLSRLRIDKGHPYSFTRDSIRHFLGQHGFQVRFEELEDYRVARAKERSSPSIKDKIKGYSGLTEFVFYAVCSKQ